MAIQQLNGGVYMENVDKFFEVFNLDKPEINNTRDIFESKSNIWRTIVDNQHAFDSFMDTKSTVNYVNEEDISMDVVHDVLDYINTTLIDSKIVIPILDFDGENVFVSLLNILETGAEYMDFPNGSNRYYLAQWKQISDDVEHIHLNITDESAQVKLKQAEIGISHFIENVDTELVDGVPTISMGAVENIEDISDAVSNIFDDMDKADEFYDFYEKALKQVYLASDTKTNQYIEKLLNTEYKDFIDGLNTLVEELDV